MGEAKSAFAEVVVPIPVDKSYTYRVPEALLGRLRRGMRVLVPFGARLVRGYCVGLPDKCEVPSPKEIVRILDEETVLDETMLQLTRWVASYYFCSWGQALDAALPSGVRRGTMSRRSVTVRLAVRPEEVQSHIARLGARAVKQQRVLRLLAAGETDGATPAELAKAAHCTVGVIDALRRKGLLAYESREAEEDWTDGEEIAPPSSHVLTEEQQAALLAIRRCLGGARPLGFLLHGVTGSGKTEVYLRAIQDVVNEGKQAIVLVPEISLTPQTVRRFRERFERVAVLHSNLTEGQRHAQWRAIEDGSAQVVVGARSAVFAPTRRLGIIVIDEEHENSFKQQEVPRYHAREVAFKRAELQGACVVMGTATPSLESYHAASSGLYGVAELTHRIERRPLPEVETVDMRREVQEQKRHTFLSRRLKSLAQASLSRGEQVILFLNRRGFATYVFCPRCGYVLRCPRCDISLTYHHHLDRAICHHCSFEAEAPKQCPECLGGKMRYYGTGTEQVEEEIRNIFPDAKMARMDSDVMQARGAHRRILGEFRRGNVEILLGTQMIAKGLDFPNVTLVGVISADTALNLPDFRAVERTFQLLAQVAGRTGRGPKGGRVLIQSFNPDHYSVTCAASHDFKGFAEKELAFRKELDYPPYAELLRIVLEGQKEPAVIERARALGQRLRSVVDSLSLKAPRKPIGILGPAPAPIARIRRRYRWQMMAKGKEHGSIQRLLEEARGDLKSSSNVQVVVDVDPIAML